MSYHQSRLHGVSKTFYEDGRLKRIVRLENNRPVGEARLYSREGVLIALDYHDEAGRLLYRWQYGGDGYPLFCEEGRDALMMTTGNVLSLL